MQVVDLDFNGLQRSHCVVQHFLEMLGPQNMEPGLIFCVRVMCDV